MKKLWRAWSWQAPALGCTSEQMSIPMVSVTLGLHGNAAAARFAWLKPKCKVHHSRELMPTHDFHPGCPLPQQVSQDFVFYPGLDYYPRGAPTPKFPSPPSAAANQGSSSKCNQGNMGPSLPLNVMPAYDPLTLQPVTSPGGARQPFSSEVCMDVCHQLTCMCTMHW